MRKVDWHGVLMWFYFIVYFPIAVCFATKCIVPLVSFCVCGCPNVAVCINAENVYTRAYVCVIGFRLVHANPYRFSTFDTVSASVVVHL